MVHSNNMVVVVRVKGGILREDRDTDGTNRVYLPFGSDYSLYFKNMDSRSAVVTVTIDGQDVLDGNRLVIYGNREMYLDGWMDGTTVRHAFRFTKKTQEIVEHRGDKIDDGIIRIAWRFEKPKPEVKVIKEIHHHEYYPPRWPSWPRNEIVYGSSVNAKPLGALRSRGFSGVGGQSVGSAQISCQAAEPVAACYDREVKTCGFMPDIKAEEGVTVKGADRYQNFGEVTIGELEETEHVVCIKLYGGDRETKVVEKPVLTRAHVTCEYCGRKSRTDNKFCPGCGNALR